MRIRHTLSIHSRLEEVLDILGISNAAYDEAETLFNALTAVQLASVTPGGGCELA